MRDRLVPTLVAGGYGLLLLAWVVGNAPFAGPDEAAHYLAALGVGGGQLTGAPAPEYAPRDLDPVQLAGVQQEARRVTAPPKLSPSGWSCHVKGFAAAACLDRAPIDPRASEHITAVGTYQPAAYALPGVLARRANDPGAAVGLGRAASAATAWVLIAAAAGALYRPQRGAISLVGLAVAMTPMVVATAATLNPSGPEIAAGIALIAALLRCGRDVDAVPRWIWVLVAASGAVLALSRSSGPFWLAVIVLLTPALVGPRRMVRLVREAPRATAATAIVALIAVAANRLYEAAYGHDYLVSVAPWPDSIIIAWPIIADAVFRQALGLFGYGEVGLPWLGYVALRLLVLSLLVVALLVGRVGRRIALAATTVVALVVPLAVEVAVFRNTGFHLQGRHVLSLLVAVPLLAGEIITDRAPTGRREARAAATLAVLAVTATAAVQVLGWVANAARAGIGTDGPGALLAVPSILAFSALWDPAWGWTPWLLAALAGALLLVGATVISGVAAIRTHPVPQFGSSRTAPPETGQFPGSQPGVQAHPG